MSGVRSTSFSTTVVLPVPDGAETTKRRPRWPCGAALLNVLHLLAHPLELRLHVDDDRRDLEAFGLRPDRVDLAVHLLQQEVELPAARLRAVGEIGPVHEVGAEADQLLVDVRARHEADDLL